MLCWNEDSAVPPPPAKPLAASTTGSQVGLGCSTGEHPSTAQSWLLGQCFILDQDSVCQQVMLKLEVASIGGAFKLTPDKSVPTICLIWLVVEILTVLKSSADSRSAKTPVANLFCLVAPELVGSDGVLTWSQAPVPEQLHWQWVITWNPPLTLYLSRGQVCHRLAIWLFKTQL